MNAVSDYLSKYNGLRNYSISMTAAGALILPPNGSDQNTITSIPDNVVSDISNAMISNLRLNINNCS